MSIIKHVTLQKIIAHDFRYDPPILSSVVKESQYPLSYQTQKFINKTAKRSTLKPETHLCAQGHELQLNLLPNLHAILNTTPRLGRNEASSNAYFLTLSSAFCSKPHHTCHTPTRNVHNKRKSSLYENGKNRRFLLAYSHDTVRCCGFSQHDTVLRSASFVLVFYTTCFN